MLRALQSFPAIGVTTNLPFLIRAIDHPAFRLGDYDTGFVQKYSGLTAPSLIQALNGPAMALADHFWQLATPTNTGRAGAAPVRLNGPWQTIQRANFP
jgi:acetyl/propionyl-CoA carboxylase alpha subunit